MPVEPVAAVQICRICTRGRRARPNPLRSSPPGSMRASKLIRQPSRGCSRSKAPALRKTPSASTTRRSTILHLAGAQAGVLNSVAADKAVRDQAQNEAQRVAMAGSALSLNRAVYEALAAISLDAAAPPPSTTSSAPSSATAWPASIRTRPPRDPSRPSTKRPPCSRSSSAATSRRAARPSGHARRARRPPRRLPRPPPARCHGHVTITTDPPDMHRS